MKRLELAAGEKQPAKPSRPRKPLAERLWSKVAIGADDQCWPWIGKSRAGRGGKYGLILNDDPDGPTLIPCTSGVAAAHAERAR